MPLNIRPPAPPRNEAPGPGDGDAARTSRWSARRVARALLILLGGLLVFLALTAPREVGQLTPLGFLRIPVEAIIGVAVLLVLPARVRRPAALVSGALLALLTVLRVLQMGFLAVLARPFDPIFDWSQLASGVSLLGPSAALVALAGSIAAAAVLVVVMALATGWLVSCAARHRTATSRAVAVLTAAWLACFALGAQVAATVPVAARSTAAAAYQTAQQVVASLQDQRVFDQQVAADRFRDTPDTNLLTALRGKDVVLTYVESYGRSALENPQFSQTVGPILDEGTRRLAAAGFDARSAFLTSSVVGGGSWLAHATLSAGVRVANQHSFEKLVADGRLTLTAAFRRAGWDTVAVQPSSQGPWPEREFYGFKRDYDSANLGNRSRIYDLFQTPDQYTLAAFERTEHGRPDRGPLMAEIPLVSSHWPWAEIPRLLDWDEVGDGSVFDQPGAGQSDPADAVEADPDRMRDGYRRSIEYSLSTLISYVQTYGDDDLVLIFLGDHQPAPFVTGNGAGQDVPITIVTRDRTVLDRIGGWGWYQGLRPGPQAPVWPMEDFRDRFLTTFGPSPVTPTSESPAIHH